MAEPAGRLTRPADSPGGRRRAVLRADP